MDSVGRMLNEWIHNLTSTPKSHRRSIVHKRYLVPHRSHQKVALAALQFERLCDWWDDNQWSVVQIQTRYCCVERNKGGEIFLSDHAEGEHNWRFAGSRSDPQLNGSQVLQMMQGVLTFGLSRLGDESSPGRFERFGWTRGGSRQLGSMCSGPERAGTSQSPFQGCYWYPRRPLPGSHQSLALRQHRLVVS